MEMFNGYSCQCRVLQIIVNQSVSLYYHPFILSGMCMHSDLETVLSYSLCVRSVLTSFAKL